MDQVVKSLRNWARARARMADKRGRFQGSNKKDNVVACYCWCWLCLLWDGMIPCPCAHLLLLWIPMEWNDFVYYEMTFVGLLCIQFNLFIFKSLKKKKKKNLYIFRERERDVKEDKSERRVAGRSGRERWILLGFCYEETNREWWEMFFIFYFLFFFIFSFFSPSKSYTCTCI